MRLKLTKVFFHNKQGHTFDRFLFGHVVEVCYISFSAKLLSLLYYNIGYSNEI